MRAVILSAGQGSRLLPLTADRPKCLLPLKSRTLLQWQVETLAAGGVNEIAVVVGFRAAMVEEHLAALRRDGLALRTILNPFFNVADNLGSCWLARGEMTGDFLIVNGDTMFEPAVLQRLLTSPAAPITVTIDRKDSYDADDMKVQVEGTRLLDIGKTLPLDARERRVHRHAAVPRRRGRKLFCDAVDRAMRQPEGLKWWYLKVIAQIAKAHEVQTALIQGLSWGEVDYPADLLRAERLAEAWEKRG